MTFSVLGPFLPAYISEKFGSTPSQVCSCVCFVSSSVGACTVCSSLVYIPYEEDMDFENPCVCAYKMDTMPDTTGNVASVDDGWLALWFLILDHAFFKNNFVPGMYSMHIRLEVIFFGGGETGEAAVPCFALYTIPFVAAAACAVVVVVVAVQRCNENM